MRMILRLHYALLAVTLVLAGPASAGPSVQLGSATLRLGQSEHDALTALNAQFALSPQTGPSTYNVYNKLPGHGYAEHVGRPLGSVHFDDERLVTVTRNLGVFRCRQGAAAIAQLIQAIGANESGDAHSSAHVDSWAGHYGSHSRLYFSFPESTVQIVLTQPQDGTAMATVSVSRVHRLAPDTSD